MKSLAAIGIDAGSTTCKLVGVSADGEIIGWRLEKAHPRVEDQVRRLLDSLLKEFPPEAGLPVVATGYGRRLVWDATLNLTEISCHARGVYRELGESGTLVDIGGQDSKVIVIGPGGQVVDFVMNDKCSAGTGRFLENTAARLDVPLEELGDRALAAEKEETITSTCTVFAESEIISLIAHGAELEPILRGLHRSLISRIVAMIHSVGLRPPLMLSGGVANNAAIRHMLSEATGQPILLPRFPHLMGAYGAALIGLERASKSDNS